MLQYLLADVDELLHGGQYRHAEISGEERQPGLQVAQRKSDLRFPLRDAPPIVLAGIFVAGPIPTKGMGFRSSSRSTGRPPERHGVRSLQVPQLTAFHRSLCLLELSQRRLAKLVVDAHRAVADSFAIAATLADSFGLQLTPSMNRINYLGDSVRLIGQIGGCFPLW